MPLISIVIPTYNRSAMIVDAIHSVLSQPMKDVEILVVDDGSTDPTRQVLEEYTVDGSIRYLWQSNAGECCARNFGIQNARGKYIAFLDSDDLYGMDCFQKRIEIMENHPEIGLVHGDFEKFLGDFENLGRRDTSWFQGKLYPGILGHWSSLIHPSTVMVAAEIFNKVGYFRPDLHWGGDLEMWWRIARQYEFAHVPDILARVRVHSASVSANRKGEADAFQYILNLAFQADPALSPTIRRQVQGQMYTFAGLNLLGDYQSDMMPEARRRFGKALHNQPFSWNACIGLLLTVLPYRFRKPLSSIWRSYQYPVYENLMT